MTEAAQQSQEGLDARVAAAVRDFHHGRAKRLHVSCVIVGLAAMPNRFIRNPEWLQAIVFGLALCTVAVIGFLVFRYFYLKGHPEKLELPTHFLQEHETLLEQLREKRGIEDFKPKVLADLMPYAR
jgi:hypothetical protein